MSRVFFSAVLGFLLTALAAAQLASNPLLDTLRSEFQTGIPGGKVAAENPVPFKRQTARNGVGSFLKPLFDEGAERAAIKKSIESTIGDVEKEFDAGDVGTDPAVAVATSVVTLYTLATGNEVSEESLRKFITQLYAIFSNDSVKKSNDRQRQDFFEYSLSHMILPLLILAETETEEDQKKVITMAGSLLTNLLATDISNVSFNETGIVVKATKSAPVREPEVKATGGLAPGFTHGTAPGFVQDGPWYINRQTDDNHLHSALVRFLPAIPAAGNMGDALVNTWKTSLPKEFQGKASSLVFRRFVGDGMLSQFIFGYGREPGRGADTLYTLHLVDCGSYWQPVAVAQTFEMTGSFTAGEEFSAQFSYPRTSAMVDPFLATFRCPTSPRDAIVAAASLAGTYNFGSGANMQWVNIYTGATSTTFVSYGGTLELKPDQTFTYTYTSASGAVGATTVRGVKGSGTWSVDGDVLTTSFRTYDQGDGHKVEKHTYRVAGLTQFTDGEKIAILISDLNVPISATTVLNQSGSMFTTKKKE